LRLWDSAARKAQRKTLTPYPSLSQGDVLHTFSVQSPKDFKYNIPNSAEIKRKKSLSARF
jgi:hypothetical protein